MASCISKLIESMIKIDDRLSHQKARSKARDRRACWFTEVRSLVGSNLSQEAGSHQTPAQDAEPPASFTEPGSGRQRNCLELSAAQSDR